MFNIPSSKEKLLCPYCIKDVLQSNQIRYSLLNDYEFKPIYCESCLKFFTFLICPHCKYKIYFQSEKESKDDLNGLNGTNIKCPYLNCNKFIFITKCPKCNRNQKLQCNIPDGKPLTCQFKECSHNYLYINCPVKNCQEVSILNKEASLKRFPDGMLFVHNDKNKNEKIIFQKIICHYCIRPIIYKSTEKDIQRYYEGQKIICPYEDCKKAFNRITCPICSFVIIFDNGWYRMGTRIKCANCQDIFSKILCPKCNKILTFQKGNFTEGYILTCGFKNCRFKCQIVNCVHCRRMNFFSKENLILGQAIRCHYSDCKKIFNQIICPFCNEYNVFPNGDFFFGRNYQCIYRNCLRMFTYFICPFCFDFSMNEKYEEGLNLECLNCRKTFFNTGCPFCKKIILVKQVTVRQGQLIQCPNIECNKIFSFIACPSCKRLVFSRENKSIFGQSLKCSFIECKCVFITIKCNHCEKKIILKNKEEIRPNEIIKCPNCKKEVNCSYESNETILKDNLILLNIAEGNGINFGKGNIDENFIAKNEIMIKCDKIYKNPSLIGVSSEMDMSTKKQIDNSSQVYYNNSYQETYYLNRNKNVILKVCMLCQNNPRESVFVPCGHRCTCYHCGILFFTTHKKCPKCQKDARTFIKRIYQ